MLIKGDVSISLPDLQLKTTLLLSMYTLLCVIEQHFKLKPSDFFNTTSFSHKIILKYRPQANVRLSLLRNAEAGLFAHGQFVQK